MTKRALIIIAILVLIPVVIGLYNYKEWKNNNKVVATYGETVDEVIYGSTVLKKIEGSEDYLFKKGKYLGKVDDKLFGTQLYTVADDANGDYYAIAGNDGLVLMNETGRLSDGMRGRNSKVTRVIISNYLAVSEQADEIALVKAVNSDGDFKFTPDDYKSGEYTLYTIHLCFDGSAISTETFGKFVYLSEKNKWVYLSEEQIKTAETAKENGETEKVTYIGTEVENPSLLRLLQRLVFGEEPTAETSEKAN